MSMTMSEPRKPLQEPERFSDYQAGGKPLTGWKVLAMIVSFFLVVVAVDGLMAFKAVGTFSGEVVQHPYERGLAYNRDIAQAREQATRGWKVTAALSRLSTGQTEIRVDARDAEGAAITGVEMNALLAAPADLARDLRVKLEETAPGRYVGVALAPAGQRDLVLTGTRGGDQVFRSKNRIDVR